MAREETGYSIWAGQQPKVVGCCPGSGDVVLQPQLACCQLKPPAYRLGCENVGMAIGVSHEGGGL